MEVRVESDERVGEPVSQVGDAGSLCCAIA